MSRAFSLVAALLMIATLLYPQGKKSKKPKSPDAMVDQIAVRRDGDVITLDGTFKNTGERTLRKVTLFFEFFGPDNESLTIQKGPIESELLEPGDEAEFRLQVKAPVRAIQVKVEAQDKDSRDLNVQKNGPFPIE